MRPMLVQFLRGWVKTLKLEKKNILKKVVKKERECNGDNLCLRFQAKGMDVGVSSDIFNGIDYEESSSSDEEPVHNGKWCVLTKFRLSEAIKIW